MYQGQSIQRIKRGFGGVCKRDGIEVFRFYDLRHCAASNLRRAGVDTLTAMKIIGHQSENMHKRFNSLSPEDLTQATQKLYFYLANTLITPASNLLPANSVSV
ncbi:tyrosine-type recombinase/integrase [Candidatus Nitrospira allomarina]|uniref:tyrosine-type recombinase/integrase n=1 Tax=Candidatus Nitrospira allomarina TaxID=3020900 RepID=UPI0035E3E552